MMKTPLLLRSCLPLVLVVVGIPLLILSLLAEEGTLHWFAFWSLALNAFLLLAPMIVMPLFLMPALTAHHPFRQKTTIAIGMFEEEHNRNGTALPGVV